MRVVCYCLFEVSDEYDYAELFDPLVDCEIVRLVDEGEVQGYPEKELRRSMGNFQQAVQASEVIRRYVARSRRAPSKQKSEKSIRRVL